MRDIDVARWTGDAADAFRERFDESPVRWFVCADAFADAATACDAYRRTVLRSRDAAAQAVAMYRSGVQASAAAVADRNAAVQEFEARSATGPPPAALPEFADPGTPMIEQATRMLADARRDRDAAGVDAARVIEAAAASAPDPPSTLSQAGAELSDGLAEGGRVLAGIGEGVEDAARFVRAVNPLEPWNVTHPASYVDGLSSTLAGTVTANLHPAELVKGVLGTGWGSDPATALGKLIPGLALSAAAGGATLPEREAARSVPTPREAVESRQAAADLDGGDPDDARPERPPPKTDDSPDLPARAELNPWFAGEQYGQSMGLPGHRVTYFNDEDRENARLTIRDGRLYDVNGKLFDSALDGSFWSQGEERSIFVMDGKGNLYASDAQEVGRLHHSSFLAGQPVAGAGEITVRSGEIEYMSDRSGHYTPPGECLDQVREYLRKEGVSLDRATVDRFGR